MMRMCFETGEPTKYETPDDTVIDQANMMQVQVRKYRETASRKTVKLVK